MAKTPNSIIWGSTGQSYPSEYTYEEKQRPVDQYDDYFNWATSKDIHDLFGYIGTLDGIDGVKRIDYGLAADRPTAGTAGRVYITSDDNKLYVDDGASWIKFGISDYTNLNNRSHGNEDHDEEFLVSDDLTKARGATYSGNYSTLQDAVNDSDYVVIVDPSQSYGDVDLGGGIDLIGYAPTDENTHNIGTITITGSGSRVKNVNADKVVVEGNSSEVSSCIIDGKVELINNSSGGIGNHSRVTNNEVGSEIVVGDVHNVVVSNNVTRSTTGAITTDSNSSSSTIVSNVGFDVTDNGSSNQVGLNAGS
jgi:hypothetical protein